MGLLTFGNRKFESLDSIMRTAIKALHTTMQQMIPLVDKDTNAFKDYMASLTDYNYCLIISEYYYYRMLFNYLKAMQRKRQG